MVINLFKQGLRNIEVVGVFTNVYDLMNRKLPQFAWDGSALKEASIKWTPAGADAP
jgi:hypothetical protein